MNSEPNTVKIPSFTTWTTSSPFSAKHTRRSSRRFPTTIAATNTAMKPLPVGGSNVIP